MGAIEEERRTLFGLEFLTMASITTLDGINSNSGISKTSHREEVSREGAL